MAEVCSRRQLLWGLGLAVAGPGVEAQTRVKPMRGIFIIMATPYTASESLDDYRDYYAALARATKRPVFVQTTGGAKGIVPEVDFLAQLAEQFPNCGYIKEEYQPVIERMRALASHRPAIKSVFSGSAGKGMLYEMRLGFRSEGGRVGKR